MALNAAPRPANRIVALPEMQRKDKWWVEPLVTVVVLVVFSVYATWRAFEANYYTTWGMVNTVHYLSPFYSPPIQEWTHLKFPISPALYVLIFPLSFRATCYFCRRSYYRAFFWDPPACAVREIVERRHYTGERKFPFTLQNLHRYTLYAVLVFVGFHWMHLMQAFFYTDRAGATHFGMGLGTLVLGFDTLMLSLYVFSCHSFRHLVGGFINRFSGKTLNFGFWSRVTALNLRHGLFFWLSLASVGLADLYVRLVASGAVPDVRFF